MILSRPGVSWAGFSMSYEDARDHIQCAGGSFSRRVTSGVDRSFHTRHRRIRRALSRLGGYRNSLASSSLTCLRHRCQCRVNCKGRRIEA